MKKFQQFLNENDTTKDYDDGYSQGQKDMVDTVIGKCDEGLKKHKRNVDGGEWVMWQDLAEILHNLKEDIS